MRRMTFSASGMTFRRVMAAIACGVLITALSSCTNSDFDLDADDAVGTWRAGSELPTTLELADDGTFQATGWPIDAGCSAQPPETAEQLRDSEMVDFSGTWVEGDAGSQNSIRLSPVDSECLYSSISADFRSEDGVLYTCILLGVHVDLATAKNWLILYLREPEATPDSNRCFNYN